MGKRRVRVSGALKRVRCRVKNKKAASNKQGQRVVCVAEQGKNLRGRIIKHVWRIQTVCLLAGHGEPCGG